MAIREITTDFIVCDWCNKKIDDDATGFIVQGTIDRISAMDEPTGTELIRGDMDNISHYCKVCIHLILQ